jgi:hypothetical protein
LQQVFVDGHSVGLSVAGDEFDGVMQFVSVGELLIKEFAFPQYPQFSPAICEETDQSKHAGL